MASIFSSNVVDLTMDTSSEGGLTADEVVVAASRPVAAQHRDGRSADARRASSLTGQKPLARSPAAAPKPSRARSPSVAPQRRTPNASPAARSARPSDDTPSRPARFSARDEIRDSQSPPPTVEPTRPQRPPTPQPSTTRSPAMQTPKRIGWTVDKIASALRDLAEEVSEDHARLVDYVLEEAEKKVPKPRHLSSFDAFASMKSIAIDSSSGPPPGMETMAVKFKQHSGEYGKSKGNGRRAHCPVLCIKPNKEPVPRYRFHHVEIRKNILAPNSMLNFVPHLRDVDPNSVEEQKYGAWLMDLESLDAKSGFKIQSRIQKLAKRVQSEYAATLAPYVDRWLRKLAIDGCTKTTLIRYMASQPQNGDAITPQQKSNLLDTHGQDVGSPHSVRGAKLFTQAFDRVFHEIGALRRVALRDILMLDRSVEPILENKRAKDGPASQKPRDEALMQKTVEALGSYSTLGCLICFSHDCEHGEIERDNQKRCFSLEEIGGLAPTLRKKWATQVEAHKHTPANGLTAKATHPPCRNQCYRSYNTGNPGEEVKPWSESEVGVLEWTFAAIGYSPSLRPECFVGAVLGRHCWDVHRKLKELDLTLPPVEPRAEQPRPKAVPWYDRKKKQLLGDWQDATITHEHAVRELYAPCHHDGPCTAANGCPCASGGSHPVLCERFCLCTAEECALKFTGCACHSSGKTCLQRQKEGRPCICVQLNRECDPVLCKGCGAKERADPENAHDEQLHSTGCQNVPMQRGAAKALLLGKSQLEACGYGLFAAEDIAQDEFVIEYTGELISHDEGVRRENRRGDVFDEENKVSYLFTLLEQEGIWVDAAIYGNLSRYVNHASDNCNIMPRIMYVNHEFRIKFCALRDIKAGEELFFNYGDNFPNLTKKLVERNNEKASGGGERSAGQKRKGAAQRPTARKTTSKASGEGVDFALDERVEDEDMWLNDLPMADDEDDIDDWADHHPRRRKKRGGRRPGAGRKKKQPPPTAQQAADTADEVSPGSQLRTESGGGIHPGNAPAGHPNTPTRRRSLKKRSYTAMLNPQQSFSGSEKEAAPPPPQTNPPPTAGLAPGVKKVSKRGGARPGAGRKPKHRHYNVAGSTSASASKLASKKATTATTTTTPASSAHHHASQSQGSLGSLNNDTDNNNSNNSLSKATPKRAAASTPPKRSDMTLRSTPRRGGEASAPGSGGVSAAGGAGRKRKAAEVEAEDAALGDHGHGHDHSHHNVFGASTGTGTTAAAGLYRHDTFQPITDDTASAGSGGSLRGGSRSRRGSGGGGEGFEEDDDDVVDRSARKRQKPWRYRDEEE